VPDFDASFAPGQYVTVFRSRLRGDAGSTYHDVTTEMLALARDVPGFVDFKTFTADDGERVSLVTFDGPDSHAQWRDNARHRDAQRMGRSDFYEQYSIQVCECRSARQWSRTSTPVDSAQSPR
jgi:heme-degrading monooxygenase HmoA